MDLLSFPKDAHIKRGTKARGQNSFDLTNKNHKESVEGLINLI